MITMHPAPVAAPAPARPVAPGLAGQRGLVAGHVVFVDAGDHLLG